MQKIKAAGGHTIAQDEKSSAIWGMPGEAVALGCVDQVVSLPTATTLRTTALSLTMVCTAAVIAARTRASSVAAGKGGVVEAGAAAAGASLDFIITKTLPSNEVTTASTRRVNRTIVNPEIRKLTLSPKLGWAEMARVSIIRL